MLSQSTIDEYIKSVPAIPKIVKACITTLDKGDLVRAADIAQDDRALMYYLQNIVNKPIFGFRSDIKDARQIFGILGLSKAKQLIYGYFVLLIVPKAWEVFDFNTPKFQEFQARLIHHWGKIVDHIDADDDELIQVISIIPASLVICEMLFRDINDTVQILRNKKNLTYEEILLHITQHSLFDIASQVALRWGFSENIAQMIQDVGKNEKKDFGIYSKAVAYMRLLLMFEMSRPLMIQSGLSELFVIDPQSSDRTIEQFYSIMQQEA